MMQNLPNIEHIIAPSGWYGADIINSPHITNYKTIYASNYYSEGSPDYDWSQLTKALNLSIGSFPTGVIQGSYPYPSNIIDLRVSGNANSGSWRSANIDWSTYSKLEFLEFSWTSGLPSILNVPTSMKTLSIHTLNGETMNITNSTGLETMAVFGAGGNLAASLATVASMPNLNSAKFHTVIRDSYVQFKLNDTSVLSGLQSVTLDGYLLDDITDRLPLLTNLKSLTLHNWDSANASALLCSLASKPAATTLQSLMLFSLTGTSLPSACLGSFTNLRTLLIDMGIDAAIDDQDVQPFPTNLYSLSKIETLYLRTPSQIPYNGELRSDLWSSVWKNADWITLCMGQLSGTIPWEGISNLRMLNLTVNRFTSWPPFEYGVSTAIPSLQMIDFSSNLLTVLPDDASLQRFTSLSWFDISNNPGLDGPIPNLFGSSSKLTFFAASNTILTGTIPVIQAPSLTVFAVDGTSLCGPLPTISRSASQVPTAAQFYFQNNMFNGTFPSSWRNEAFYELNVAGNELSGTIPDFLFAYSPIYTQQVYLDFNLFNASALNLTTFPYGSLISLYDIGSANICTSDPGVNPDAPFTCQLEAMQVCECVDYWSACINTDTSSCEGQNPWFVRRDADDDASNLASTVSTVRKAASNVMSSTSESTIGTKKSIVASRPSRASSSSPTRKISRKSSEVVFTCTVPDARAGRAAPPVGTSCPGTRPSSAFYCDGTSWRSYSDVKSNGTLSISSGSTVVVTGSLTVDSISFESTTSSLSVSGCVYNLSSITVSSNKDTVTQVLSQPDGKYAVTFITQSCSSSGAIDLSLVPISLKKADTGCKKVSVQNAKTSSNTLVGLFTVDSSDCNIWWIVVITIGAVVIVVIAIILLMFIFVPSVKTFILPYHGTNARSM